MYSSNQAIAPFWPGVHGVVVALDAVDLQNGVVFLEALIIRHHAVGALLRRGPSGGFPYLHGDTIKMDGVYKGKSHEMG